VQFMQLHNFGIDEEEQAPQSSSPSGLRRPLHTILVLVDTSSIRSRALEYSSSIPMTSGWIDVMGTTS